MAEQKDPEYMSTPKLQLFTEQLSVKQTRTYQKRSFTAIDIMKMGSRGGVMVQSRPYPW